MRYEIKGGVFPIVVCYLENGEQMITEKGSMVWQSPNVKWRQQEEAWEKCFQRLFQERVCFRISILLREAPEWLLLDPAFRERSFL